MSAILSDEAVSMIREQSRHMELTGALTPEVLNVIYDHNLFKLFVPEKLGGNMTPLPDALRTFEYASWIDGSFGWLVNIGSGGGFFISSIVPSVSQKLFSDKKAVIAGSGYPSGSAKRVNGGFLVSGQWKFCSGSTHATAFTANCMIESSKSSNPEIRSFILLPDQVNLIKDWNAFGLKATASHSITVDNVFVPQEMTFNIADDRAYYSDPVFQYPFLQFAQASFAAVAIGICKHFLEEAKSISERNKETWGTSSNRFQFVMSKIDEMERLFTNAINDFYKKIDESWEVHTNHKLLSEKEQEQISRQCKETRRVALHCAQLILPYLGINAIMEDTVINRTWRDLHTACQNVLLVPFYES